MNPVSSSTSFKCSESVNAGRTSGDAELGRGVFKGDIDTSKPEKARKMKKIHIAVAGCSHGEMDKIYATLAEIERTEGYKFDLLISCGDYQAIRNYGDLRHMHVSDKYRNLQTFYRYYSGELTAPILTLFVGGNHESSGFLGELPNGGWVAPRIYYMGHASVVQFAGLRIAGLSGIYNKHHYQTGHWERPPFNDYGGICSSYYVRSIDIFRLKQLRPHETMKGPPVDIMISHDWPAGITDYGDVDQLLKLKPYFKEDIQKNTLGNPASLGLLFDIRPRYWLAAHLHCIFAALVPHQRGKNEMEEVPPTRFLSLDKPLPHRHFLQALEFEVPDEAELKLSYDPIWLAILKLTDGFTCASKAVTYMPSQHSDEQWDFRPSAKNIEEITLLLDGDFTIPENFRRTAPPHESDQDVNVPELYYRNPQSAEFCARLGIRDLNEMLCLQSSEGLGVPFYLVEGSEYKDAEEAAVSNESKFDDACDFFIDRKPSSVEPSYLKDFSAPTLKSSPENPGEADEKETVGSSSSVGEDAAKKRRLVGSGVFKRRQVDLPSEDD